MVDCSLERHGATFFALISSVTIITGDEKEIRNKLKNKIIATTLKPAESKLPFYPDWRSLIQENILISNHKSDNIMTYR